MVLWRVLCDAKPILPYARYSACDVLQHTVSADVRMLRLCALRRVKNKIIL